MVVCGGALGGGPGTGGGFVRPGVGLGEPDARAAVAVMLANCGAVGLYGEPGAALVVLPRIRCTMNGGTLCEPPCDPPRWCVGRVGDDGPALGRGGCGGLCEPLRRYADARRDSAGDIGEIDECVE